MSVSGAMPVVVWRAFALAPASALSKALSGVLADPACSLVGRARQLGRQLSRRSPERRALLAADRTQRPVDALLHEVALVRCGGFNQRKSLQVVGRFAATVQRHAGQQREGGAPPELVLQLGPRIDLGEGVRDLIEQLEANRVGDGPVVEIGAPAIHLFGRDVGRVVDHAGDHAAFVPAGLPECGGETMVAAKRLGDKLHLRHRHAQRLGGDDAVPRAHVLAKLG